MASLKTFTFLTSTTWNFTGSAFGGGDPTASISASFIVVGAGGHGSATGNGGSGGAFAQTTASFVTSGSKFYICVGQPTATDGGTSSFAISGSTVFARAAGGRQDGTIAHQVTLTTGSYKVRYGGLGGEDYVGYDNYSGAGGGGAGGYTADGEAGQSGFFTKQESGALGGLWMNTGATQRGGVGAYYNAGPGNGGIMKATDGEFPGCGGGGGFDYGADSSGTGGAGYVVVMLQDW